MSDSGQRLVAGCGFCGTYDEHTPVCVEARSIAEEYWSRCPACADPIDYCQGHGLIGDPDGYRVLKDHHLYDVHVGCHPDGCEEKEG